VLTTREPSDGPIGTQIRQALAGRLSLPDRLGPLTAPTLALLFAADRVDHAAAEVEPALARGAVVLCDRYLLSSLAYQTADLLRSNPTLAQAEALEWISQINAHARAPDLTLFLSIAPKVAAQRRAARGGRPELFEAEAFQESTARLYEAAIALRRKAGERIAVIDAALGRDAVTAACLSELPSA
jgi:dTMP kinase